MIDTGHHTARDTAVRPMVFSHVAADQPVTSPNVGGYADEETPHTFFSAGATTHASQPKP